MLHVAIDYQCCVAFPGHLRKELLQALRDGSVGQHNGRVCVGLRAGHRALLTPEFLEIAREGKAFLPVEYHDGEKASRFFYRQDTGRIYLAAFHFHPEPATLTLPVTRIGTLSEHALFTNSDGSMRVQGPVLEIALAGCDCVLLHCDLA